MITDDNWKSLLAKRILGKASKNKCVVGKLFQRIFLVPDEWRERVLFGTVHAWIHGMGTVPRHRVNGEAYPYLRRTFPSGPPERNWYWGGGCERSELKWGSGGFPPGKFFKTTPFLSLETPFLYKLHNSNDVEMTLFRCLIDNEHYLQNF